MITETLAEDPQVAPPPPVPPAVAVQAPLGNVVVLHGIMGGELALFDSDGQDLVWVNLARLAEGQYNRLPLDEHGFSVRDVRATGIYTRYYGSQLTSLNKQWRARPFFFDWRRDIRVAADDLHRMILSQFGTDQPVHLVAHSMGGLVGRSYIARHPERWAKGGRLVMLGTPNYGSFAVPRLLFGINDILTTLEKVDQVNDVAALLRVTATFQGMYQMMPVRGMLPGLDVLYRSSTYTEVAAPQARLDDAGAFQAEIEGVVDPARMVYVAGYRRCTVDGIADVTKMGAEEGYSLTLYGDGTVPHSLGLLPGVKTFYVDEEHMKLPANASVQAVMTELLETGDLADESHHVWRGLKAGQFDDRACLAERERARSADKAEQAQAISDRLNGRPRVVALGVEAAPEADLGDLMLLR